MLTLRRKDAKKKYNPDLRYFAASRLCVIPFSRREECSRKGAKTPREGIIQIRIPLRLCVFLVIHVSGREEYSRQAAKTPREGATPIRIPLRLCVIPFPRREEDTHAKAQRRQEKV
jgi:hypothetical protein